MIHFANAITHMRRADFHSRCVVGMFDNVVFDCCGVDRPHTSVIACGDLEEL